MSKVTTQQLNNAYAAWTEADMAWSRELHRNFGKDYAAYRYLPAGQGKPGTPLRDAAIEFTHRQAEWYALSKGTI